MSTSLKYPLRVLVVDDSPFFCKIISEIFATDGEIELVGCARDAYQAKDMLMANSVDVLTLDLEMPRMDGITFLRLLMERRPMPVLVLSTLTTVGSECAMEALMSGAVGVLAKPLNQLERSDFGERLLEQVKQAGQAKVDRARRIHPVEKLGNGIGIRKASVSLKAIAAPVQYHPRQIIALGASTGGTEALKDVVRHFPAHTPGTVIVQHIPSHFSGMFAKRLNDICAMTVLEACHGDRVEPGKVFIAPGGRHMVVQWRQDHYEIELNDGPPVEHQRPAVDVLFGSLARCGGANVVAALLTGMGRDGAVGLRLLHDAQAHTIAQDEASCVVFGMSRQAIEFGAASEVVSLPDIAAHILKATDRNARQQQKGRADGRGVSQRLMPPIR